MFFDIKLFFAIEVQLHGSAAHAQQLPVEQLVAMQFRHVGIRIQVLFGDARKHAKQTDLGIKAARRILGLLIQRRKIGFNFVKDIVLEGKHVAVDLHVEAREFGCEQWIAGGIEHTGVDATRIAVAISQA